MRQTAGATATQGDTDARPFVCRQFDVHHAQAGDDDNRRHTGACRAPNQNAPSARSAMMGTT
jgi:hypothetical protein